MSPYDGPPMIQTASIHWINLTIWKRLLRVRKTGVSRHLSGDVNVLLFCGGGAPALASTHGVELRLIDSCHITRKSRRVSALQGREFNFFPAGSSGFPTQFGPFKEGRWAFKYFFLTAPERNYLLGVDNCRRLRLGGRKGGKLLHWFHARGQFQVFVEAFCLSADISADAFITAGAARRDSSGRSVAINTQRVSLGIFRAMRTHMGTHANPESHYICKSD